MKKSTIASNINRLLFEQERKRFELAEAMGVSPQFLSQILKGKRKMPEERLSLAAEFFGVRKSELLRAEKAVQ